MFCAGSKPAAGGMILTLALAIAPIILYIFKYHTESAYVPIQPKANKDAT